MKKRKQTKQKTKVSKEFLFTISTISIVACFIFAFIFISKTVRPCANEISCIKNLSGNYDATATTGLFAGQKIPVPQTIAINPIKEKVLAATTTSGTVSKHIYVDLTEQRLYADENGQIVYDFPISSGKWRVTPTGDFYIWIKLRYTRMTGGDVADGTYYDLPNVPYTMFFFNQDYPKSDGFSIHGAYWHNNFGHPMSHGCINMRPEDAAIIYDWANPPTDGATTYATAQNPGTEVTIFGQSPNQ